jgi:hypothetical protein
MKLRKGMRVRELVKKVGQVPRQGRVESVHGTGVDVVWDDGHHSTVSGAYLFPVSRDETRV